MTTAPQPLVEQQTRTEHDLLGDFSVPANAYWGVHTQRALDNFDISRTKIGMHQKLVGALAAVKEAAALANQELGQLDAEKAQAIAAACRRIRKGELHDQFVVDNIQGGAGTSTNMNANEVIANLALEILGHDKGDYRFVHPLNDVNHSQSTNDVYPTAAKIALIWALRRLADAMEHLATIYDAKAAEFADVLKIGRTQLQDAVPMTLGQEFATYAIMTREDRLRLLEAAELISEINIGGTAIGTGLNTHPDYAQLVCTHLSNITGLQLVTAENLVEATQDVGDFVQLSGVLKRIAVKASKICNDLRLLSSGPRAGLGEINLPPVQAGSSIMPGKVNPVIPEVVNQIAFEVIGHDVTISLAAEAGQLQLNAFEPVIVHSLFECIDHLRRGLTTLADRCIAGITANQDKLRDDVWSSVSIVTALSPYLGYETSTTLAQRALAENRSIPDIIRSERLIDEALLAEALKPENLTHPWIPADPTA